MLELPRPANKSLRPLSLNTMRSLPQFQLDGLPGDEVQYPRAGGLPADRLPPPALHTGVLRAAPRRDCAYGGTGAPEGVVQSAF